jgi:hypothetical protein
VSVAGTVVEAGGAFFITNGELSVDNKQISKLSRTKQASKK